MTSHPFRFYGAAPADYIDDQLAYELCFTREPTDDDLPGLAQAIGEVGADTHLAYDRKWMWSGRFALFVLDHHSRELRSSFRDDIPILVRAIHEVVPLEQVLALGVLDACDPWTVWSQETPIVQGPRWGGHLQHYVFGGVGAEGYGDRAPARHRFWPELDEMSWTIEDRIREERDEEID